MNSSSIPATQPSVRSRLLPWIKPLLIEPLGELKLCILLIILSLLLLSASQSIFLLLVGPLFKAIFNSPADGQFQLTNLFPPVLLRLTPEIAQLSVGRRELAKLLPISILVAAIFKAIASFIYQHQQQVLALHLGRRFREKLFAAMLRLPFQRLIQRAAGEWMSIIMNDVSWLQVRLSDLLTGLVRDGFMVLASLAALYVIHWPTALLLTALAVPMMISMGRTGKRIGHYAEHWQRELGRMVAAVLDLRKRFEFIRAQSGENLEKKRFSQINQAYYSMIRNSIFIRSALSPLAELAGFLMFAGILYAVGSGVKGFKLDASQLLQFFAALGILLRPLKSIGEQLARYHETRGILRQSLETFVEVSVHAEAVRPSSLPVAAWVPSQEELKIQMITVSYKDSFTLTAENMVLKAGKAIALIGPSGAGKSSLIKVLAGLLEPREWRANVSPQAVVNAASFVSQKPFLFSASIRENLLYGHPTGKDDQQLQRELDFIGLKAEFSAMSQTLDSTVDFIQTPLSGGQMQRLTIARALLRPQPLLLMDEVTAAIDPLAEEELTRRLIERCHTENLCLLFVTHRLQQLTFFDEIWFCEAGTMQIFSTLNELMQQPRIARFVSDDRAEF